MLTRRVPRTRQPEGGVDLNRSSPLGRTITHFMPLNGDPREVISGKTLTYGSGGATGLDARGKSLRANGSAACASIALDLSPYTKLSISFWMWWDVFANDDDLALEYTPNSNGANGFMVDPNSSTGSFTTYETGTANTFNGGRVVRPSAADWHHYLITYDRTTGAALGTRVYVDGAERTLTTPLVADIPDNFANSTLYIFSRGGASLFGAGRMQNLVLRGGYIADGAEARAEYENPWQLFAPQTQRIPTGVVAAASGALVRLRTLMGVGV